MRWMVWNFMGGLLWIAGLLCVKGHFVEWPLALGGYQFSEFSAGIGCGAMGLLLLMYVNLLDVS